ncbi:peptidoglycan-binding protein [Lentzea sp. NPDC060358]|uniref:peptidoglycan-binding domain-containing protein n=1 Tax=Lentzea sp. NPDC060358 TaxID=3347103 RepID=UPI00364F97AD
MALLFAAALVPLAAPGVAQAAPSCNSFTTYTVNEGYLRVPSIGWATGNINCDLGRGNVGDAVRVIQVGLNSCRGEALSEDGEFGSRTEAAVRREQARRGVSQDGRYGPITRRAGFPLPVFPTFETWNKVAGVCYNVG